MTDDLVKRLYIAVNQFYGTHPCGLLKEAADHIEKLEKNFELQLEWYLSNKGRLDDRIEELEAALREIVDCVTLPAQNDFEMREIVRKALEDIQ